MGSLKSSVLNYFKPYIYNYLETIVEENFDILRKWLFLK